MRRFVPALTLIVAACASAPQPAPQTAPTPTRPATRPSGAMIGLDVRELGQRFGQPHLQVQEGVGTKLQWVANGCVLDVYLYPPASGTGLARVTHVDARRPSGADLDVTTCISLMGR